MELGLNSLKALIGQYLVIIFKLLPTERQVFLATWKDIPNENELQYQIKECHLNAGEII